MDSLVVTEAQKVLQDYNTGAAQCDGLIYMMFVAGSAADGAGGETGPSAALPLYIGKAEKFGRGGGNLSANIAGIRMSGGKFARRGYNYAYHIGDLSAVVCPGHAPEHATSKYTR